MITMYLHNLQNRITLNLERNSRFNFVAHLLMFDKVCYFITKQILVNTKQLIDLEFFVVYTVRKCKISFLRL